MDVAASGPTCAVLPGINTSGLQFDHVGACLVGADGSAISTWTDSAAAANNLTGNGGVNIPTIKAAFLNGGNVARDTGGGGFTLGTSLAITNITYVAVIQVTNLATARPMLGGAGNSLEYRIASSGKQQLLKTAVAGMGFSTTAISTGTWYTVAFTYSSPNVAFY